MRPEIYATYNDAQPQPRGRIQPEVIYLDDAHYAARLIAAAAVAVSAYLRKSTYVRTARVAKTLLLGEKLCSTLTAPGLISALCPS